jgi:hypothetical protein
VTASDDALHQRSISQRAAAHWEAVLNLRDIIFRLRHDRPG